MLFWLFYLFIYFLHASVPGSDAPIMCPPPGQLSLGSDAPLWAQMPPSGLRCPPLGSDAPLTRIGSTVFYGANFFTVVKQALTVDVGKHCAVNEQQLSQIFHTIPHCVEEELFSSSELVK